MAQMQRNLSGLRISTRPEKQFCQTLLRSMPDSMWNLVLSLYILFITQNLRKFFEYENPVCKFQSYGEDFKFLFSFMKIPFLDLHFERKYPIIEDGQCHCSGVFCEYRLYLFRCRISQRSPASAYF